MLTTVIGLATAGVATGAAFFAPQLLRPWLVRRLRRVCGQRRTLVLSYDDGPGRKLTPMLLDLLEDQRARATFFVLGMRAARWPEIVTRTVENGHELGCHGYYHRDAWRDSPTAVLADIRRGYDLLARWGQTGSIYRPPRGKLNLASWWALRRRSVPLGFWTIDSGDTHPVLPTPASVVERVQRERGGVVLLHDHDRRRSTRTERFRFVLETTERLLETARAEGLTVVTLGQLLQATPSPLPELTGSELTAQSS